MFGWSEVKQKMNYFVIDVYYSEEKKYVVKEVFPLLKTLNEIQINMKFRKTFTFPKKI